jgi:hypothetical protein
MPMQGMTTDYTVESQHTVAIKFPETKRPPMLKSSYPPNTWRNIVSHAHRDRTIQAHFVMDDSDEGRMMLQGTDPSDITTEFLLGMEEVDLREMADIYSVKHTTKNNKKAIALKIMAAIADGVQPLKTEPKAADGV